MEEYVYVLVCDNNIAGECQEVELVGIFRNLDMAKEKMKEYIETCKTDNWVLDEQYEEGDTTALMFYKYQENWSEHFELTIFQKEIE